MRPGESEDLFERYRSAGDLDALARLFDLAAPELLRLAVHLAPDAATAEDLVQQAFLVALQKPHRWRAGEPLLPWLFGILSNLAKKHRRQSRRAPEPDRLRPRTPDDPARAALSAETRDAVRSALERLPELYRDVVRASLLDDKPPQLIARELDRAPGTVRMQLLRGLELLRRALPGGLAGGGALVLCGTRGEVAIKAAVLEQGAAHAALGAGTSTLALGGLLVSTKTVLATLVAVAGLCTWLLWPHAPRPGDIVGSGQDGYGNPLVTRLDEQGREQVEVLSTTAAVESRGAVEASAAEAARPAAPGGTWLVGRLLGVAPEHAAEVELEVSIPAGRKVKGKARADGSFEIELGDLARPPARGFAVAGQSIEIALPAPPAGGGTVELDVWTRHPRYLSEREVVVADESNAQSGARRELRRDIQLRPAAVLSGRVRAPAGWKVENADVQLHERTLEAEDALLLGLEHANCDAEGRYAIKSLRRGEVLVRAELPGLLPVAVYAAIEPGRVLELPDLVLEESACAITGRIDLPPGLTPGMGGLTVFVSGLSGVEGELQVVAQRVEPASPAAPTGALGGVVLDEANARRERELRGGCDVAQQSCTVDGDGGFVVRGLEPGNWELTIHGLQAHGTLPLSGKTIVEAPAAGVVLGESLGSIALELRDSRGSVADATVTIGDGETFLSLAAGAEGRVRLVADVRKDYRVSAGAPGREKVSLELPAAARARDASFTLRLPDPPASARLVLLPAVAQPPKSVQVHLKPDEGESELVDRSERVALADGRYELDGILPGRWRITVGPGEEQMPVAFYGDYMLSERFELALAPGSRVERGLRCERGGRLRLTIEAAASLKSNGVGCALVRLDGAAVAAPIFVSALSGEGFGIFGASEHVMIMGERTQVALQDCLVPGRYELRLTSSNVRAEPLAFEIASGETTQATWRIGR